jgi:hypothetical protein
MSQSALPGAPTPLQSSVQRDVSVQKTWHGGLVQVKVQPESPVQLHWLPPHSAWQVAASPQSTVHGEAAHWKMQVAPLQVQAPLAHSPMHAEPAWQLTLQVPCEQPRSHSQPAVQPQAKPHSLMQHSPSAHAAQSVPQPPPTPTSMVPPPPMPPTPPLPP